MDYDIANEFGTTDLVMDLFAQIDISPDYAHNFICDHILGIDCGHTQPTLF